MQWRGKPRARNRIDMMTMKQFYLLHLDSLDACKLNFHANFHVTKLYNNCQMSCFPIFKYI